MLIKRMIIVVLFLVSLVFYYDLTDPSSDLLSVSVERVIDGDTLKVEGIGDVRLLGVNTPEKGEFYYEESYEFLKDLVENKTIQVDSYGSDKYQRTLGYIFLDGENINALILEKGFASLYYYEKDGNYEKLKAAEEFARENELGIWKRSSNFGCVELVEFEVDEPERLVLRNSCSFPIDLTYKDDATHIYEALILAGLDYENNFSHIWNSDGDSIYVYDDEGLVLFYRY